MRNIGIIGLGHVGRLLANELVMTGAVDELTLIDRDDDLALAVQTDLADAATVLAAHPQIVIQDYAALGRAQVLVVAVGHSALIKKEPMAELAESGQAVIDFADQVKQSGFHGIVLNLTNPNEAVTAFLQQQLALPSKQVLGIGTVLETARMRRAVAHAAHLSSANVTGFVYGQHAGRQAFAWSTVRVNGQSLTESINGHQLDESQLKIQADLSSWYTLHGLGYNASAAVAWAQRIIAAILSDEQLALPVAIYQPQYSTYVSFPALIGRQGIGNLLLLKLLPVEEMAVKTAAASIKQQLSVLQELAKEGETNDD
ncbi:lactate/malate family dehydrogenase [Limosilactobacillus sp.]|uniref:lactate/malate family dehydrogenase n=1 Tax=Limosilactobacillus sp. TaxID=2773925 RepID=UPI003F09B5B5